MLGAAFCYEMSLAFPSAILSTVHYGRCYYRHAHHKRMHNYCSN